MHKICVFVLLAIAGTAEAAPFCSEWSEESRVATLPSALPEASGLVASKQFPGTFYFVDDAKGSNTLFVYEEKRSAFRSVSVEGFQAVNFEAVAEGSCDGDSCLYLGDIGDNKGRRSSIQVAVVKEEQFGSKVRPLRVLELSYPDGAHNAESMAVAPNGDLVIVTKEKSGASEVYRLAANSSSFMKSKKKEKKKKREREEEEGESGRALTLEHLGSLAFPQSGMEFSDMAFHPTEDRAVLMSHEVVYELKMSAILRPSGKQLVEGVDFYPLNLRTLEKQEGVSYGARGEIYWTSESDRSLAPLMKMECLSRY